jgi:hypothetical protein
MLMHDRFHLQNEKRYYVFNGKKSNLVWKDWKCMYLSSDMNMFVMKFAHT